MARSRGVIFSGTVLLQLAQRGIAREEAYLWVQRNAMRSYEECLEFKDLLLGDLDVMRVVTRGEVDQMFDLAGQLRHVDTIFERVFGKAVVRNGV